MKLHDDDDVTSGRELAALSPKTTGNLRLGDLKSSRYREDPSAAVFPDFASARREKKRIALYCLHQLIGTGLSQRCVADKRSCLIPSVRRCEWSSEQAQIVKHVGAIEVADSTVRFVRNQQLRFPIKVSRRHLVQVLFQ